MRKVLFVAVAAQLALLAACGGGGGGGMPAPPPPPPGQVIATPGPPNVEPITIDAGPSALANTAVNTAFVSVQICLPGTQTCQTIDHIQVDTGSSGLRILGEVLNLNLPVLAQNPGGLPIAECLQFADGSAFGPVAVADVVMPTSGKGVAGMAVHIIGASNYPTVPSDCPGTPENTVATFGANGILGVGPFMQDCGPLCADAQNFPSGFYYTCPAPATCAGAAVSTDQQVSNPVIFFNGDNNGVIVELPAVASGGAASANGSLVFGIATQTNNALGSATVLPASASLAYIQATYNGTVYDNAALDSGSNGNFFTDNSIPTCPDNASFFCPSTTLNLSATLKGTGTATAVADFTVVNADNAFMANPNATVMPGLSGPLTLQNPTSTTIQFDLGMPFFLGRNVFTAIEGQTAPGGPGPYFAY